MLAEVRDYLVQSSPFITVLWFSLDCVIKMCSGMEAIEVAQAISSPTSLPYCVLKEEHEAAQLTHDGGDDPVQVFKGTDNELSKNRVK